MKELIEQYLEKRPDRVTLYEDLRRRFSLGGKHVRGTLLLESYRHAGGKDLSAVLPAAAAIELLHASSLVHDDIMDEDEARRGQPSMHVALAKGKEETTTLFTSGAHRFGVSQAILQGNILLLQALEELLRCKVADKAKNEAVSRLVRTYQDVNEGQMLDLDMGAPTEDDYLTMAGKKTAALLAASLRIGALLAGASEKAQQRYHDYGMALGLAYQIRDDLLDLSGEKGHARGSDITQDKWTLLRIHASKQEGYAAVAGWYGTETVEPVIAFYESSGALAYARRTLQQYTQQARGLLSHGYFSEIVERLA